MALYSVYVRSAADRPAHDKIRLIKSGFSWLAFLFPLIWLGFNRVWRSFLLILAIDIGLVLLGERLGLPDWTLILAGIATMTYVGIAGRDWLGLALERRGFKLAAMAAGEDEDEAFAAFIRRPKLRGTAIAAAIPAKSPETGPVIGLFPDPEARI